MDQLSVAPEPVDLPIVLARNWPSLVLAPLVAGAIGLGASFLLTPKFVSVSTFLSPQQAGTAASALASLGALSSLAGGGGSIKSPVDQYIALMQSVQVSDRIIDQFKLMQVYEADWRYEARRDLAKRVNIVAGKKDGMIRVEVADTDPKRAAEMANQYVSELRRLTLTLAITEAQQRRQFFERQLQDTRANLTKAQLALQEVGVSDSTIKAEPRAAAEAYGKLRAELTAAEVMLRTMGSSLANQSVEMRQQAARVQSLREQLARIETSDMSRPQSAQSGDYVSRFREYKYQETLFDLYARQYELARADESRDGTLIQVVDVAQPAERKSSPRRGLFALGGALLGTLLYLAILVMRAQVAHARKNTSSAQRLDALWRALRRS